MQLHVDGPAEIPAGRLDRVAEVLARVRSEDLRDFAAAQLLELHNDTWREDDAAEIDAAVFASRLTPESVGVREDGRVEVFFDDGDLFSGHVVIVNLDADLRPDDAAIAG